MPDGFGEAAVGGLQIAQAQPGPGLDGRVQNAAQGGVGHLPGRGDLPGLHQQQNGLSGQGAPDGRVFPGDGQSPRAQLRG